MCKESRPIRLHSSVVLQGLVAFSPKPGLQKKMASSSRFGLVRGEMHAPGSSTTAFFLQCKQSLLSSFCSAKAPAFFCLQQLSSCSRQLAQKASQAAAIVQYELRAKSCWGRRLLPHSYLSSLLMQWKRLQKSSYQKNMKPVESAAFIRLGVRPLKKPRVPSSCSTRRARSRRPL